MPDAIAGARVHAYMRFPIPRRRLKCRLEFVTSRWCGNGKSENTRIIKGKKGVEGGEQETKALQLQPQLNSIIVQRIVEENPEREEVTPEVSCEQTRTLSQSLRLRLDGPIKRVYLSAAFVE